MFIIKYKQWKIFVENNVMQQGDDVDLNEWRVDNHLSNTFFMQGILCNNVILNALYIIKYICIEIYNKMNTNWT